MSKKVSVSKHVESTYGEKIIDIFVFLVLCLFPLVVTDFYFNILVTKYYFYVGSVLVLAVLLFFDALLEREKVGQWFSAFQWSKFRKSITVTDVSLLIFLVVAVISTVCSDYVYESFWGNEGRYSGLFLLSFYGFAYYAVSRFGTLKSWHLDGFLIASILVCLFGITDYFQLDILGFKKEMVESQKALFTSTLGNINTYTAFVGMVGAAASVLFAMEKNRKKLVFYYAAMVVSLFALIMGVSDNAYLSLLALLGFLPLLLFKTRDGMKRYLIIVSTVLTVFQCISWINHALPEMVLGIDSAFNLIADNERLIWGVLAMWAVTGVFYAYDFKTGRTGDRIYKVPRLVWLGMLALVFVAAAYMWADVNLRGNANGYGPLGTYLLFNDDWGTHRGYIWRNAMESFSQFSLFKKIFGFGPDTFAMILMDKTADNIYGEIFDNAHNEYLHYLLTVGAAGLAAYLMFIGSFIVRAAKKAGENKLVAAAVFAVICYCAQATVNLNLPIATPVMWMFLMLAASAIKKQRAK
ncbi:MAG TPA: O-antigen ligase family protein [Candidatus Hungatella pullicola]|nr:O-antigen ligase family protein [Candidatus Hungatella pullicola]